MIREIISDTLRRNGVTVIDLRVIRFWYLIVIIDGQGIIDGVALVICEEILSVTGMHHPSVRGSVPLGGPEALRVRVHGRDTASESSLSDESEISSDKES